MDYNITVQEENLKKAKCNFNAINGVFSSATVSR